MKDPRNIRIEEYDYPLPEEKIAKFPLKERDRSKLLVLKDQLIFEKKFNEIPELLPENALLVFNETKVIQARLLFQKPTGAVIEIFCLEPVAPSNDFQLAFQEKSPVIWQCLVGNAKRWKQDPLSVKINLENEEALLQAEKIDKKEDGYLIKFSWSTSHPFSQILETAGNIPLPPYLNRKPVIEDKLRYQTVYARHEGSVAAPTAGLHFTENTLQELKNKGFKTDHVTLHVGAGTFKPVSSDTIGKHEMHTEQIIVKKDFLKNLINQLGNPVIPVGTTSMRTLESLFWMGTKLYFGKQNWNKIDQWDPYQLSRLTLPSPQKALSELINHLENNHLDDLKGETQLMIAPGYSFQIATGLITNFHQPKSTLLLLVSALIGEKWKEAYQFALKNNFRFLSYGDSCLFLP